MGPVVLYIFMALVNGAGIQAEAHGTEGDCLTARAEALTQPGVLAASECVKIELHKILPKA